MKELFDGMVPFLGLGAGLYFLSYGITWCWGVFEAYMSPSSTKEQ